MDNLISVVRKYSGEVKNDRTQETIVDHMASEVQELREELANGSTGADGIIGENIDIIACALDSIFLHAPDITDDELVAIMVKKCLKWKQKYSKQD